MVQPIVARRSDGVILGGHQRYQAAKDEGWREVPVVWWEGPDAKARALNLALNRISGDWDEKKLGEVLAGLADVDSLSNALLGFETDLT
jgi:ParB-like chromosome segregation protein Spo0J